MNVDTWNGLKHNTYKFCNMQINSIALKILRWIFIAIIIGIFILVIAYNFIFQNYEMIGESIQCETNSPIGVNYMCKLDIIDNDTQYWSFQSEIPDGIVIPSMMVCLILNHRKLIFWIKLPPRN